RAPDPPEPRLPDDSSRLARHVRPSLRISDLHRVGGTRREDPLCLVLWIHAFLRARDDRIELEPDAPHAERPGCTAHGRVLPRPALPRLQSGPPASDSFHL